jgi:hypothetical protein
MQTMSLMEVPSEGQLKMGPERVLREGLGGDA